MIQILAARTSLAKRVFYPHPGGYLCFIACNRLEREPQSRQNPDALALLKGE